MDKLKMQTENIADKNFEVLSKMFPNALTETITGYDDDGKPIVERAIDADVLRQEISCKVVAFVYGNSGGRDPFHAIERIPCSQWNAR